MKKKEIYFIRHSEVYNPGKLCYGQSEMPLEENFTAQFDWIKEHLHLNEGAQFYSSPLRRCTKLTSYLSDDNFTVDSRISDINFGFWEMKAWDEIPPKELTAWETDFVNYKAKNGECFYDLADRSISFYEEITATSNTNELVVVTHAGVIRSIVAYVLDFPLEKAFNLQIDYNSISKISFDPEQETSSLAFLNLSATNCRTPGHSTEATYDDFED